MSHTQYTPLLSEQLQRWLRRPSRHLSETWRDAALVLLRLHLDPARPLLHPLSAPGPRGRPPYAPLCMRRALLLLLLLHYKSLSTWASDLRRPPRLAQIAGFPPCHTPAAAPFYDFIDRLEDGPYTPPCPHRVRVSRHRTGRHRRHLTPEKAQRHAAKNAAPRQADTLSERLAQDLLATADQPRPQEFLTRLADLLFRCAVLPSATRGLLGTLQNLVLCGDSAALPTGASPHGRPPCTCRPQGIFRCDHEHVSRDPTATWGYDAYRDPSFFGPRDFPHCLVTDAHTRPLQVLLEPAHATDVTLGPTSLDRRLKTCVDHHLPSTVRAVGYDSGQDALGLYRLVPAKHIGPVIALTPRRRAHPAPTGTATAVTEQGVPLGPAGLPMRRHRHAPKRSRLSDNCPVKRPTHRAGHVPWVTHEAACPRQVLCQPHTQRGPVVYVRTSDTPRLSPPLPRASADFKALLARRRGGERSNALQKATYRLGERPCRSATHFLVRLSLGSLLEQAPVWRAEARKQLGDDPLGWAGGLPAAA